MSEDSIASTQWVRNTGDIETEVPWLNSDQTSNDSLKCTFMSVATNGWVYAYI